VIVIGALMIIPRDGGAVIECIACGLNLPRVVGVISILIGVAAFATRQRG